MMKKIMWGISLLSLAGTAIVIQFMPERVPMHYDFAGNVDRWGSKYENFIFPVIILFMSLVWTLFLRYYDKKAEKAADKKEGAGAKSNARVLGIVSVSMAAMFTVMQGFLLYSSYSGAVSNAAKQAVDIGKISVILLGVILIVSGNFMPKTRINSMLGVRISWSMYNDNTWRKSNRFGAYAIMATGLSAIILAVFMKSAIAATVVFLGIIIIASVVIVLYSHKVYVQEIEAERGEKAQ